MGFNKKNILLCGCFFILTLFLTTRSVNGQVSYSIDLGKIGKSGRVTLRERIDNSRKKGKIRKAQRKERKAYKTNLREINRFNRKYQSKQSKKMMKRSIRKSKRINRRNHQFNIIERMKNRNRTYGLRYQGFYSINRIKSIFYHKQIKRRKTISRHPI